MARRSFVAGNWKMNKTPSESRALAQDLRTRLEGYTKCDIAVFPTYLSIAIVSDVLKGCSIDVGTQNMHWEKFGAYTGAVSPQMLVDAGVRDVIVGHSERRQYFGDNDEKVNKRIFAALAHNIKPIVCVGETKEQRLANVTEDVIRTQVHGALLGVSAEQMSGITIAYEPVWAIGTGLTATPAQAQDVHAFIRGLIRAQYNASVADALRIQYGGSVKADNAASLLSQPDIDGALVGGASLVAADFEAIVKAAK